MTVDRTKLDKVLALVGSDNAGEALAAVRMAKSMLDREGLDFAEVVRAGLGVLEKPEDLRQERRVEDAFKAFEDTFSSMGARSARNARDYGARPRYVPADGQFSGGFVLIHEDEEGLGMVVSISQGGHSPVRGHARGDTAQAIKSHLRESGSPAYGSFTLRKGRITSFAAAVTGERANRRP